MAEKSFRETLDEIKGQSSFLGSLDERAVEIAVILPLLQQAGWNTWNMAEVYPQSPVDNGGKVDYALKIGGEVQILVEVKSWDRSLQEAEENQLAGYCRQAKPSLAVLTSGKRWLLYLPPKDSKDDAKLQLFLEFDITSLEPDKVQENFERFLSRDKFSTKSSTAQVVKEAEGLFEDIEGRDKAFRRMAEAWNSLTDNPYALVGLIQSITAPQPDEELVLQFLDWAQEPLVNLANEKAGGTKNPVPQYITFQAEGEKAYDSVRVKRSAWRFVLDDVCKLMQERHPDSCDRILDITGFARSEEGLKSPIQMERAGLYFDYPDGATGYRRACADVLAKFGYAPSCLTVRVKGGTEMPVWPV